MSSEAVLQECLPLLQRPGVDIRSWYMKRMKSLERNFISREKADAILPMPVIWKACSMRSEQMQSFYTVVFMDTRISR